MSLCVSKAQVDSKLKAVDFQLFQAAFDGDVGEIKRLVAAGANVNVEVANTKFRPIYLAAAMRRNDAVRALMDLGADFQTPAGSYSVFGLAAERGQTELCRTLLARGFKLHDSDGRAVRDIGRAILSGKPEIVDMVLFHGFAADELRMIDALNGTETSAMRLAAQSGSPEMIRYLAGKGVPLDGGGTAYHYDDFMMACFESSPEVVHAMIECGANPVMEQTFATAQFAGPVMRAAAADKLETVHLLLGFTVPQRQLDMGAFIADQRRNAPILKLFRDRGGDSKRGQAQMDEWAAKGKPLQPTQEIETRLDLPKLRKSEADKEHSGPKIVVSASGESVTLGDLLAARFSQAPDTEVFAGNDIRKILGELELQDGEPGERLTALAGRLPPVDLMLDLTVRKHGEGKALEIRALDVETGILVFTEKVPWPLKNLKEWADRLGNYLIDYQADRRKAAEGRTPVVVLDFRAQIASEESKKTEKRLASEVIQQLSRIPSILVAEREQLSLRDAALKTAFGDVRRAGFLAQGSFSSEVSGLKAKIAIQSAKGEKTVEIQGNDLDQLATGITLAIVAEAQNPDAGTWSDPQVEREAFLKEARWAASQQLWKACLSAADSGWILGLKTCEVALLRTKARLELLKEMHRELRMGSDNFDWIANIAQPNWPQADFELNEILCVANALLADLREALVPGRFDADVVRNSGFGMPVAEVLTWATATLETPKSITREQENLYLMSAIRAQCLDIVRQITSENAPAHLAAPAAAAMPVWGECLAYWSESPDKFLPHYEEFAAVWDRLQSRYPAELPLRFRHPLEFVLTALEPANHRHRNAIWSGDSRGSGERTSWVGFIEPAQAQFAASDDPARRLTAAWLMWMTEPIRVKKQKLVEQCFQKFQAAADAMVADPRLCRSFYERFFDPDGYPPTFSEAEPNFTVRFPVPGIRAWWPKELIDVLIPIYRKGYEKAVPVLDVDLLFWSLRGRWAEEMAQVAARYADGIADPKVREEFKAGLARVLKDIRGPMDEQDRPAIVLENPWCEQVLVALAPGEELKRADFNSNFAVSNGRVFFCAKLRLQNHDYKKQPNVLFSVDPRTNDTKYWRLPDGPKDTFRRADVLTFGNAICVAPRRGEGVGPVVVVPETGKVFTLPDLNLAEQYFATDDRNGAIFAYNTSGATQGSALEKASLGRLDLDTGKFEVVASSRRKPAANVLDGEEVRISFFAWDREHSRLLVTATHPEGEIRNRQRYFAGIRAGENWNFVLLDDSDPAGKFVQQSRPREWKPVIGGLQLGNFVGKPKAVFAKDRWIDCEYEIRDAKRKKEATKMTLAFDVVGAQEIDREIARQATGAEGFPVVGIAAIDEMGVFLDTAWPSGAPGQDERFWFVPMEKIEAYIRAGNHIRSVSK
ncbi:MAG TPA: ankyrin repeat domain-containing protein [Chthoniobacterales bacterium]